TRRVRPWATAAATTTATATSLTGTPGTATAAGDVGSLGTEVVLAGTEPRHEATCAGTAVLPERVLRTATGTRATRAAPAGTTRTTAATTRATGSASAARTAASTASTITEVARRRGELPADARARHLAAAGTIVVLALFARRARLEAAEATRTVAIAAATEATGATTATLATIAATTTTIVAIVATALLRRRDAIDHVMELSARDRALRALLALEHAHESNLIDAITDDVERLEQTLGALRLNVERGGDGFDGRILAG